MKKLKNLKHKDKMRRIILLILSLILIFISVVFYKYNKSKQYLQYTSDNLSVLLEIESYLNLMFSIRGELPNEDEINEFLLSTDSILFKKNEYSIQIDKDTNSIQIYTYGPDGKNQNLNDVIDIRTLSQKGDDVTNHYGFSKLLFNWKYDVLLFKDNLTYNCSDELVNGTVFEDKKGKYFFINDRLNSNNQLKDRLSSLLKSINLSSQLNPDKLGASSIYIYNGIELKNMCGDKYLSLSQGNKNELFNLLKKEFKDYNYVKFLVTDSAR